MTVPCDVYDRDDIGAQLARAAADGSWRPLTRLRLRRSVARMCGIIGIFKYEGNVNVELYEGLLMLQHRGQDSAGMVTTDWNKFKEYKANGLVKDVFSRVETMDKMTGT